MSPGPSFLERGRARLCYEVHGSRDDALPLLLTHGFGASREMWRPNLDRLAADRTVIVWDLPGHGSTVVPPDPAEYSPGRAVAHMAGILDHLGVERAIVGGLSLGGFLALAFHLEHPERVAGLVLADTGPGYKSSDGRERWNVFARRQAEAFEAEGLDALAASPETAIGEHDPVGLALAARFLLTQHDASVIESLPEIRVPGLVIVGGEDAGFLPASTYMAGKMPFGQLVVIEGAGHAANIDRPDEFCDAVSGFVAGIA